MTKLINTVYETGEWPKYFIEDTMIALNKKIRATKYSENCTISPIAHTEKIIENITRIKIERKIKDVLKKISLDLEEEKILGMHFGL